MDRLDIHTEAFHPASQRSSNNGRTLAAWTVITITCFGFGFSVTSQAQTYRCVQNGTVAFADRPCGDNAKRVDVAPASGTPSQLEKADARRPGAPANSVRKPGDADQRVPVRGQNLIECMKENYNNWYDKQKPRRPPAEERNRQMDKVSEDCRKRYPEGLEPPPPPPPQASVELDALRNAIAAKNIAEVKALLDANGDPNAVFTGGRAPPNNVGTPALIFSINNSTEEVTRLLVERGAKVSAVNKSGDTALHAAAGIGRLKTIDLLLGRGANISAQNLAGFTPLHSAIHGLEFEAVKYLLAKGASINSQDKYNGTPLMDAISSNYNNERLAIIRVLLDSGADANIPGVNGDYPLHAAIVGRSNRPMIEVIQALLKKGAKVDVRNSRGETPVVLAERLGRSEVLSILGRPQTPR